MANTAKHGFVKDSLEQAHARIEALEKEANKVLGDLVARTQASRKELTMLMDRFQAGELFESARTTEKELVARAERIGGELSTRLQTAQERILRFVGVASRDQIEDVVAELERLSKRLEKLSKVGKPTANKRNKNGKLQA